MDELGKKAVKEIVKMMILYSIVLNGWTIRKGEDSDTFFCSKIN